tara:strand:- start:151 stop:1005 length:855 start_codon:yes stop_codon:yes gene_type:complete
MKKIFTLIIELIHQIRNRSKFRSVMQMEVFGMKIIGQGHMIAGYSSLDHATFLNTLKEEVNFLKKLKSKNEITIVDAGANLGFYSIFYSMIEDVNVISFEPFPETFKYLEQNISSNKISNIKPLELGLFSETTEMSIGSPNAFNFYSFFTKIFKFTDKDQAGCASVFTSEKTAPVAKFIKGDDCSELRLQKHIDLIKIDVEGSELFVLKGLKETILKKKPALIIEFSTHALLAANVSSQEIWNYLRELGYSKFNLCGADYSSHKWRSMEQIPEIKGAADYFFIC